MLRHRLADRRHLKLTVLRYYDEAAQEQCDTSGSSTYEGAANLLLRWQFLD